MSWTVLTSEVEKHGKLDTAINGVLFEGELRERSPTSYMKWTFT